MHITYDDFKFYLGETIEYCQTIEHDIKWIYSMLLKGEPNVTFDSIRKDSLGMVVNKLEPMDKSDGNPFFSNEDYKMIKQITSERNYLCHEIYRTFLYINNFLNSKEYSLACQRLISFHDKLKQLQKPVEDARLRCVEKYRR